MNTKIKLKELLAMIPEKPKGKVPTYKHLTETEEPMLINSDGSVLDKKWCREKVTYTPDKTAIKNAIKAGQTVAGARLVVNQNIQIK